MDANNNIKTNSCTTCNKTSTNRYSKCKIAGYCCRECQVADWPSHKFFCDSLPFPFEEPTRHRNQFTIDSLFLNPGALDIDPSLKSITGILLPPDSLTPKIVEIPLKDWHYEEDFCRVPDIELFVGEGFSNNSMQTNPFTKKKLSDILWFAYAKHSPEPNRIIEKINKGQSMWRGPVLINKMEGHDIWLEQYADVNMSDLKNVVDFFRYNRNQATSCY
jgi:hypothetical protein